MNRSFVTLEYRKDNTYFDKTGKQILEGDLLKVYHYGHGNRTRYMYHVAVMEQAKDFPVMSVRNYNKTKPHCRMYVIANENRILEEFKIISEFDFETKRKRIKIATPPGEVGGNN